MFLLQHRRCRGPVLHGIASALGALAFLAVVSVMQAVSAAPVHGLAMQGEPALPPDFAHLPYANPDAPKGGRITYGVLGTFDNLHQIGRASCRERV